MKTLEQHNAARTAYHAGKPMLNGIECPNCRFELCDAEPQVVRLANPPVMDVVCGMCGFHGERIA